LNSAYGFDFLYADRLTPQLVKRVAEEWPDDNGWPTWAFENHDAPRAVSRWADAEHRETFARTKMLLLCSLRGSITLWEGEELGLPQVDVPFDQLQDPEAIANWPHTLSRDGARTPMPWASNEAQLGFSSVAPWLPVGENHRGLAVDLQEASPGSMLNFTRDCLELRKERPSLRQGSMSVLQADNRLLVFERMGGPDRVRCTFNLSSEKAAFHASGRTLVSTGDIDGGTLGPYAAVVEEIS
jgi:alpha-glucosidase